MAHAPQVGNILKNLASQGEFVCQKFLKFLSGISRGNFEALSCYLTTIPILGVDVHEEHYAFKYVEHIHIEF